MVKRRIRRKRETDSTSRKLILVGILLTISGIVVLLVGLLDIPVYKVNLAEPPQISEDGYATLSIYAPYIHFRGTASYLKINVSKVEIGFEVNGSDYEELAEVPLIPNKTVEIDKSVRFELVNPRLVKIGVWDNITNQSLICCVLAGTPKESTVRFSNFLYDLPLNIFMIYHKLVIHFRLPYRVYANVILKLGNTSRAISLGSFTGEKTYVVNKEFTGVKLELYLLEGPIKLRFVNQSTAVLLLSDNPTFTYPLAGTLVFSGMTLALASKRLLKMLKGR
jgi:hypothetical protein